MKQLASERNTYYDIFASKTHFFSRKDLIARIRNALQMLFPGVSHDVRIRKIGERKIVAGVATPHLTCLAKTFPLEKG